MAGVSGCSLMRWPSQLRRRLCILVLHSFSFGFGVKFNVGDFLRPVYV